MADDNQQGWFSRFFRRDYTRTNGTQVTEVNYTPGGTPTPRTSADRSMPSVGPTTNRGHLGALEHETPNGPVNQTYQEKRTNQSGGAWRKQEESITEAVKTGADVSNVQVTSVTQAGHALPFYRTNQPTIDGVTSNQNMYYGNFSHEVLAERRAIREGGSSPFTPPAQTPPPAPQPSAPPSSSAFSSYTTSVTNDSSVGKAAIGSYGVLPGIALGKK